MKAWDDAWKTEAGRAYWSKPDPLVSELIPRWRRDGVRTVLDLGFGVGRHAILCAAAGFEVYGLDSSPSGLDFASAWAEREGMQVRLRTGDMADLPFADGFFDLVLTWNVIYHGTAEVIRRTVAEIERCLVPGGSLLCTLISTRHHHHGRGTEIEPGTFVVPGETEKSHPHHYFDRAEIDRYLPAFDLVRCADVEQDGAGGYHWQVLARMRENG